MVTVGEQLVPRTVAHLTQAVSPTLTGLGATRETVMTLANLRDETYLQWLIMLVRTRESTVQLLLKLNTLTPRHIQNNRN